MIDKILVLLKDSLNNYLTSGRKPGDLQEEQVVFPEWKSSDVLNFKTGAISIMLFNLEQENILRNSDLFTRSLADGTVQKSNPEIRLNLFLLFVANYQKYDDSLRYLSATIQYFQGHRLLNHQNTPELSQEIEQLIIELVSPSFSEQNEIWGTLRLPYHPSVLYKVKMIVFQDEDLNLPSVPVQEKVVGIHG